MQGQTLQSFVIDKVDDLKAQNIIAIDVRGKSSITDCMVICTGTSNRHVISIADHLVQESRAAGMMPLGTDGKDAGEWVVVDLGKSLFMSCRKKRVNYMSWKNSGADR